MGRLRWVLLASLCLNVAFAGYVARPWLQPSWQPGAMPVRMTERIAARLPQEDADILWQVYRAREPEIRALQADYMVALLKTMRVVGQTELDKPALRAAVDDARTKRIKIGEAVTEVFMQTLDRISPKGRRQLVGGGILR
jgi:uncharacterized membrane protein